MLNGIAEYINVDYDKEYLMRKHNEVRIGTSLYNEIRDISSHDYVECGTESHILKINPDYYRQWDHILTIMSGVNIGMCEHGTGFNSNATLTSGVPPHIDFDEREGNQFNLLLPMYGVAKISIYETIQEQLEYRHGMMHWNMLQDKYPPNKIGEIIVDKPVLLDTMYLHDVKVIEAPRAIFCVAWRGINKTYHEFKEYAEKALT